MENLYIDLYSIDSFLNIRSDLLLIMLSLKGTAAVVLKEQDSLAETGVEY